MLCSFHSSRVFSKFSLSVLFWPIHYLGVSVLFNFIILVNSPNLLCYLFQIYIMIEEHTLYDFNLLKFNLLPGCSIIMKNEVLKSPNIVVELSICPFNLDSHIYLDNSKIHYKLFLTYFPWKFKCFLQNLKLEALCIEYTESFK